MNVLETLRKCECSENQDLSETESRRAGIHEEIIRHKRARAKIVADHKHHREQFSDHNLSLTAAQKFEQRSSKICITNTYFVSHETLPPEQFTRQHRSFPQQSSIIMVFCASPSAHSLRVCSIKTLLGVLFLSSSSDTVLAMMVNKNSFLHPVSCLHPSPPVSTDEDESSDDADGEPTSSSGDESNVSYGKDPLLPLVRLTSYTERKTINELRPTWYRGSTPLISFPFANWAAGRADMRAYVFLKLLQQAVALVKLQATVSTIFQGRRQKGSLYDYERMSLEDSDSKQLVDDLLEINVDDFTGQVFDLLAVVYQEVMGVISSPRKVMEWNGARMDFDERQHEDVFWPTASGTVLMAQLAEQYGLEMRNGRPAASVMEVGVGSGWACT